MSGPSIVVPSLIPPCIAGLAPPEPPVAVVSGGAIPTAPGSVTVTSPGAAGAWGSGVLYSLQAASTTTGTAKTITGREILMVGLQSSLIAGNAGNDGTAVSTLTSYLSAERARGCTRAIDVDPA